MVAKLLNANVEIQKKKGLTHMLFIIYTCLVFVLSHFFDSFVAPLDARMLSISSDSPD